MPMSRLMITHVAASEPAQFEIVRLRDGKRTQPIGVPSPYGFPVAGRANDHLMSQLAWYLERFLDYPFPPRTEQAAAVEDALEAWGRQVFDALFDSGLARDWMADAKRTPGFQLHISSDDPAILSWPWEALCDPEAGVLAHRAQIERRLNEHLSDPSPLSDKLPHDRINILLITARPYDQDVQYRSISRPLIELIEKKHLPAHVHLLRPPTFDRLREHLGEQPHFYHILHFDGHGGYQSELGSSTELFRGAEGRLVFEDEDGKPAPVTAGDLSDLLREHAVPVVVLNACQSAMIDTEAQDPFASVAAALLRSGTRSIVAMAYSLYVRAAQEFLPPFYRALFAKGSVSEAVRCGRTELRAHPQRSRIAPQVKLRDWLVPVVYQQGEDFDLTFGGGKDQQPSAEKQAQVEELPADAKLDIRYDFTGRDGALLELERAMRRKPAGILIHGLAGIGKTTLARAFIRWLRDTGGLGHGCFWFTFNEIHTAAHVLNEMGRTLFSPQFGLGRIEDSLESLADALQEHPFVIVWDNFESVRGMPEAGVEAMMTPEDQTTLRRFLEKLRGGRTKVLITSRGEEAWLAPQDCFPLPLSGLRHEEMWELAAQILDDLGLTPDRDDAAFAELLTWLGGHPIAMQVVLLQLKNHKVSDVRAAVEKNFAGLSGIDDETQRRLFASLGFLRDSLPQQLHPLLLPLGLHEKFVDADHLQRMAASVDASLTRPRIDRFVAALVPAGLLADRGQAIYEIHPLLPSFLRAEVLPEVPNEIVEKWTRVFVDVMASIADAVALKELHEQRFAFATHQANFHTALQHAETLGMQLAFAALTQSLAAYALNRRSFARAEQLFARLAKNRVAEKDGYGTAGAYHHLGRIAQEQRDFSAAEKWYLKSLRITEWHSDENSAARTYHELGIIAQEQCDFVAAKKWYLKSLEIDKRQGNEHGAASAYHQLGIIAQEQPDFSTAEKWYLKSLEIKERLGDEYGAAITYHQLGIIAQKQRDFSTAEKWYLKSLEIAEQHGDEYGVAVNYHQLGSIAEEQSDFSAAEKRYLKSLEIKERLGDEHGAASTYGQLGIAAAVQEQFVEAGRWLLKSISAFLKTNDQASVQKSTRNFLHCIGYAPPHAARALREMWTAAGLPSLPEADSSK
jgi:tetratricopeptide (TPR) repeat protein